ncbi:tRNA modification GTPase [Mycoplasmoides fastidiosum]|uniref:tRNA modification GTPase MnmE n=1 Tax=Mycoplasmoides fastidiosum TaxID=92758 RepID=A0ABU0LYZ3_9BACT|nr:tRNA uridine-5-carboxymethylaminomethyl(34) synthesis GTPase MnmE [Mycoplasmoides fastidiosum]MDQ0513823.1 tRNA modification GTPase [Mycoplasmoides fastidiosum]UUD37760.1 tRNA uridine-5-carboxymethylaminomethyl(34) synthesis GTPase MnmE [Mycoplasmoides fastidiosum]
MNNLHLLPTIAALATPVGKGTLHIIRVSGSRSYEIVSKITTEEVVKTGKKDIQLTRIKDGYNQMIDQVLLIKFVAPLSFTGEDIVEINCHGNMLIVQLILELLVKNGARLAEPGEFTKRAFLSDKLDLNNATSIMALVEAKSQHEIHTAMANLDGRVSSEIKKISEDLFRIIAECEINIDYPETDNNHADDETNLRNKIEPKLKETITELQKLCKISQSKKIGNYRIAIVGRANAGKSSLMNAILQTDRVIVSDIMGTTRDSVEVEHYFQGRLVSFVDTAGINETDDVLEQLGIDRTYKEISDADLVLHLIDGTDPNHPENQRISKKLQDKKVIKVFSKKDLIKEQLDPEQIYISSKEKDLKDLYEKIEAVLNSNSIDSTQVFGLCNDDAIAKLALALSELETGHKELLEKTPIDLVVENLRSSYDTLLSITNEPDSDIINKIFANFCLGK